MWKNLSVPGVNDALQRHHCAEDNVVEHEDKPWLMILSHLRGMFPQPFGGDGLQNRMHIKKQHMHTYASMARFVPVYQSKYLLKNTGAEAAKNKARIALCIDVSCEKLQSNRIEDHIFKAGSCTKPAAAEPGRIKPMKLATTI